VIDPLRDIPDGIKFAIDGLSIAATLGALVQWLPTLTSVLTFVWTIIRLYETQLIQDLLFGRKKGRNDGEQ
jgi:hypothetical protein